MDIKTSENLEYNTFFQDRAIMNKCEVENTIYTSQLQELARHFSSIENHNIRQYAINLVRELSKCESEERAKGYYDEILS
jgi:hypothetical protein